MTDGVVFVVRNSTCPYSLKHSGYPMYHLL